MATPKREVVFALALTIFSLIAYSEAFDSMWLVQQWPPAVCHFKTGNCPGSGLKMFTIHGLWPQKGGTSVVNCAGSPFDFTKISSKKTELDKYWPEVLNGNNKQFWDHEWTKHGKCSESAFKIAAYFQLALDKRHKYDIITALKSDGAGPNGQKKATQAIKAYIKQAFGKLPGLRCKTDTKSNKSYLIEIVMCLKQDGVTLIDCPKDTCGKDFYF